MRNENGNGNPEKSSKSPATVVNFSEVREKRLEEKRRQNERVFFKNLLSVYSVAAGEKMLPIELIEASEDGLSFHVPHDVAPSQFEKADMGLRLYFSAGSYLEILVTIKNSRPSIENGQRYLRYGCSVDTTTQSYKAYSLFVQFMRQFSLHAHRDLGNVTAFY